MKIDIERLIIIGIGILIVVAIFFISRFLEKKQEPHLDNVDSNMKIQSWIINLDKNKDRLHDTLEYYNASDISTIPVKRYSAIVGTNLNPSEWLPDYALNEFYEIVKCGYRTKHYQLSSGAMGCFLSHYNLYKQFLTDKTNDIYLILEDDIKIHSTAYTIINQIMKKPPQNWDIILLGYNAIFNFNKVDDTYIQVYSFWGTHGYLINKKGAQKFMDAYKEMDCQIDSLLSWMAMKKKLNIYAITTPLIYVQTYSTDVQINIIPKNKIDSFTYKDTYLGN
jgi:GR25 family glycosyltransferase involved in LPS biosynthesis